MVLCERCKDLNDVNHADAANSLGKSFVLHRRNALMLTAFTQLLLLMTMMRTWSMHTKILARHL